MFCAQLPDDLSSGCGNVSENSGHAGLAYEAIDDRLGKSIWISRKRLVQNDCGHLPMTRRGVFSVRAQGTATVRATRVACRRQALKPTNVPESDALQIWQTHFTRFEDVAESIRAGIAPFGGIRHGANTRAIENDKGDSTEGVHIKTAGSVTPQIGTLLDTLSYIISSTEASVAKLCRS